jgi:hypothetical protein
MIKESTYDLLRLPLHLLSGREVDNISLHMTQVQTRLTDHISHNNTFHRCISDIGGQVRALEIFYKVLLNVINMDGHEVDYKSIMQNVNYILMKKYPFKKFVTIMRSVVAHTILNIPVNEIDEFDTVVSKKSYIDLSSEGIISLETTDNPNMSAICMDVDINPT